MAYLMDIILVAGVAVCGGAGAVSRFLLDGWIRARFVTAIPVGTIFINVSGSFLLGLLAGLVLRSHLPETALVLGGTGYLGGFTTFSTSNVETVRLMQSGRSGRGLVNALGTAVLALAAAWAGLGAAGLF